MDPNTQARLDAHHGGAQFAQAMLDSFGNRFGDDFWKAWTSEIAVNHGDTPTYIDLGTGPGLMMREWRKRYPNANLAAVEVQSYMLESARAIAAETSSTLYEQDLHSLRLPLADRSVDAVLCSMVIHEMSEPIGMLLEIRRVLKDTGRLYLSDWVRSPLPQYLKRWPDDNLFDASMSPETRSHHLDHFMEHCKFAASDLEWIVTQCGFAVERATTRNEGQYLTVIAKRA